ncbi:Fungalysin metallopeptidase-domain-containing protein, partial [Mycena vulgaris]
SKTARTNSYGTEGNVVLVHLFIDALALQPCQPDFIQGRDVIILADHNRYSGTSRCLLWQVFASRSLGIAAVDHVDDFTVPDVCQRKYRQTKHSDLPTTPTTSCLSSDAWAQ